MAEKEERPYHILRYLDLQLSRAVRWAKDEADLIAIVIVARLNCVVMDKPFPGAPHPLPPHVAGKRIELKRTGDEEEYDFKLRSKLIDPTALMLNHPETTITNQANKEHLAVEVLLYAWLVVNRFHDLVWHD